MAAAGLGPGHVMVSLVTVVNHSALVSVQGDRWPVVPSADGPSHSGGGPNGPTDNESGAHTRGDSEPGDGGDDGSGRGGRGPPGRSDRGPHAQALAHPDVLTHPDALAHHDIHRG